MKYCKLKPWRVLKSDIQLIVWIVGQILLLLYGVVTVFIGFVAWMAFFDIGTFTDIPMWVEFIRLSWYFWIPVIVLKLLHMLLCERR